MGIKMDKEKERRIFLTMENALWLNKWEEVESLFDEYGVMFFADRKKLQFEKIELGILGFLVFCEQFDLVRKLVKSGWDINEIDDTGNTALFTASIIYKGEKLLEFLIKNGLDIHHGNKKGETGLMIACRQGRFETAKMLYEYGVDVNICDENGYSCLDFFRFEINERKEWVKLLLKQPGRLSKKSLNTLKAKRLELLCI